MMRCANIDKCKKKEHKCMVMVQIINKPTFFIPYLEKICDFKILGAIYFGLLPSMRIKGLEQILQERLLQC